MKKCTITKQSKSKRQCNHKKTANEMYYNAIKLDTQNYKTEEKLHAEKKHKKHVTI